MIFNGLNNEIVELQKALEEVKNRPIEAIIAQMDAIDVSNGNSENMFS
jgi:hypothetical protein